MDEFRTFSTIAAAIFLEAMPFLAVGSLLSAAIEVLVSRERLLRLVPRRAAAAIAVGAAAGFVLPTCECGVVPVVRRLIRKGMPGHMALAYLVTAPIVNPVVLVSTWVAFRGSVPMLLGRVLVAFAVASVVGAIAWRAGKALRACPKVPSVASLAAAGRLLRSADSMTQPRVESSARLAYDPPARRDSRSLTSGQTLRSGPEEPENAGCCEVHEGGRPRRILVHAAHDFIDMGKFLVLGALAAAAFKTFLPQSVFETLTGSVLLAVAGMMLLAVLLSVCSEADAFVAASFAGLPAAGQLAFVTLGPMVDLKLIGMYAVTFRRSLFVTLMVVPTVAVFVLSLVFHVLV